MELLVRMVIVLLMSFNSYLVTKNSLKDILLKYYIDNHINYVTKKLTYL